MKMRTHTCGELRPADAGAKVNLCGWVDSVRDHGGLIFIDLRDRYGLTQCVFDPQDSQAAWDAAQACRAEYVVRISGEVRVRPPEMVNERIATGGIEVRSGAIEVLNKALTPPFPLDDREAGHVSEDLRLEFRYLDLRRPGMQQALMRRHRILQAARNYLDEQGFVDIETPILTKSTPEGARDYLVPSRVCPGTFFALPQAPQQYKQLLMMAGMDRYMQIARCFRDEDLRADRQPEFTQIDLEMSFVTAEDIIEVVDGMVARVMEAAGLPAPELPLPRMTYREAMDRYGSDKPDLRFGMELKDVSALAAQSGIPLVYVNRQPVNLDTLPENQAFVGSNEVDSGTQETREVCRLLTEAGKTEANILVIMGELSNQAARQRTQDIHDVIATPECSFMTVVDEQTSNWNRTQAADLMTNWLSAGIAFDAVIANNDESAIGAIQSMKAAGIDMDSVVVGGIDATQDALAAMQAGDLDVTVFQNAAGQGSGALDAALAFARGESVDREVWVPFELVTPANIENYLSAN